jgi:cell division protein FtsZ
LRYWHFSGNIRSVFESSGSPLEVIASDQKNLNKTFEPNDKSGDFLFRPKITLVGIGGGGGNAVNNLIKRKLSGIEFLTCNTDIQLLARSEAPHNIQLGKKTSRGLGTGANPLLGRQAAEESLEEIMSFIGESHLVFITAGMGGGTGTGAAPVIADACKKKGILTVAIVTTPFEFEGNKRIEIAQKGVEELEKVVDILIVVSNQKLLKYEKTLTFVRSFEIVDEAIYQCIEGILDLMARPGLISLDFADVKAVMESSGRALIGTGEGEGKDRAPIAAEKALYHPLLDDVSIHGAKSVLLHITGGPDCALFEVKQISEMISKTVDQEANIIFGTAVSEEMLGKIRVSLMICGLQPAPSEPRKRTIWEIIKQYW